MNQDAEHLKLLSIFHYVFAGLTALFACFPIVHLVIGIAMVSGAFGRHQNPPAVIGLIFIFIALAMMLFGWALAGCAFFAGRCLAARKNYTYCLVVAAVACLFVPFGTILGVFTIIVLQRPSVKALFGSTPAKL